MPDDRVADRLADHETGPGRERGGARAVSWRRIRAQRAAFGRSDGTDQGVHRHERARRTATTAEDLGELSRRVQAGRTRQHDGRAGSGRQLVAALAPTASQDGAPGAGAHAQPEAVGLRTSTVVRLEGALAHDGARSRVARGGLPALTGGHRAEGRASPTGWQTDWQTGHAGTDDLYGTDRDEEGQTRRTGRAGIRARSTRCTRTPLVARRSGLLASSPPDTVVSPGFAFLRLPSLLFLQRLHRLWTVVWTSLSSPGKVANPLRVPSGASRRRAEGTA